MSNSLISSELFRMTAKGATGTGIVELVTEVADGGEAREDLSRDRT